MAEGGDRIAQFQKMASDDPANPIGHFSLGREYLNASRYEEAVASLAKTIELDPNISRAYQLMATALLKLDRRDEAVARLTDGVRKADERGDMMPRNAMTQMLKDLGAPVPETRQRAAAPQAVGEGQIHCQRCNRVAPKLPKPPFRNALGQEIFAKICADCWREWIGMGTKVINELRLPMSDPQAQKIYDQHMLEFLNLSK